MSLCTHIHTDLPLYMCLGGSSKAVSSPPSVETSELEALASPSRPAGLTVCLCLPPGVRTAMALAGWDCS